ncbi:potassium channel family protein [Lentilactobacillus sp. SPB1-3]|uniref:TrkA family potassium uptake protein n=1 Tax=Lentilactobacillus terminaliae TaxID=3003483 RepID=A0ACD5DF05_9LACO|nr:TrkA family potassium uptake protein [Lentilactobacillus sp. SPB1-3]MCZ0976509.1 TrkA family potassium uptake protein [Lentilactobacillus sp. SPB1-3]
MQQNFAVIGLGLFGGSIVDTLVAHGQEVLVIDKKEELVNQYRDIVTSAVVADAQNETAMQQLDIGNFDNVFISIATDVEASVMATMICKDLGVKHLVCKAENQRHARVLQRLGADEVIQPERDMGKRTAIHTMDPKIIGDLKLSGTLSVAELQMTNPNFANQSLDQLNLTNRFKITIIAVSRADQSETFIAEPTTTLHGNDLITIIGNQEDVEKFEVIATADK